MANMKRLGARLRALRESSSLTQTQLSKRTGISQNYISSLELGNISSPDPEMLITLGSTLGMTPNDMATVAGWWRPSKEPEVPEEVRLTLDRLMKLPARERDPLLTILRRTVNAAYSETQAS